MRHFNTNTIAIIALLLALAAPSCGQVQERLGDLKNWNDRIDEQINRPEVDENTPWNISCLRISGLKKVLNKAEWINQIALSPGAFHDVNHRLFSRNECSVAQFGKGTTGRFVELFTTRKFIFVLAEVRSTTDVNLYTTVAILKRDGWQVKTLRFRGSVFKRLVPRNCDAVDGVVQLGRDDLFRDIASIPRKCTEVYIVE